MDLPVDYLILEKFRDITAMIYAEKNVGHLWYTRGSYQNASSGIKLYSLVSEANKGSNVKNIYAP